MVPDSWTLKVPKQIATCRTKTPLHSRHRRSKPSRVVPVVATENASESAVGLGVLDGRDIVHVPVRSNRRMIVQFWN